MTSIAITDPGRRFGKTLGPKAVRGKTSAAASLAITGSAAGTGLSLRIDEAEEQHHTAFLRIYTPVMPQTGPGAKLPVHVGYSQALAGERPMYGKFAQDILNGEDGVNTKGYGWPAWNTGKYFSKDKLFPLVINIPGGASSDGQPYPPQGPSANIELRLTDQYPLPDMITLQILQPYQVDGLFSAELPRVVEWALGPRGIPQVDTDHVAIWGASGGTGTPIVYAKNFGTSQGVTHCVLLGPNARFLSMLIDANLSMPTYILFSENDFESKNSIRTNLGRVAKTNPGVHSTLLNGFTRDTMPVKLPGAAQQFLDDFSNAVGKIQYSHLATNTMGIANSFEILSQIGRKTTPFADGEGLDTPTWDPTDSTLNKPLVDVYDWFLN